MKIIINFRNKTVTTEDGCNCNFYEAGVYSPSREGLFYPSNIEEFEEDGYKENLQNRGFCNFEFEDEILLKEFYVFESSAGKKYLPAEELEAASAQDILETGYGLQDWELTEIETGCYSCLYWDGNNWQSIILDEDLLHQPDTIWAEVEDLETPDPAFNFYYNLVLKNGEKIKVSQSNCSGSISPFFYEC